MNAAAAFVVDPLSKLSAPFGAEPVRAEAVRAEAVGRTVSGPNRETELARERLMHMSLVSAICAPASIVNAAIAGIFLWSRAPDALLVGDACALPIGYAIAAWLGRRYRAPSLSAAAVRWRLRTVSLVHIGIASISTATLAFSRWPPGGTTPFAITAMAVALVGQGVLLAPARETSLLVASIANIGVLIAIGSDRSAALIGCLQLACLVLTEVITIRAMARKFGEHVAAIVDLRHERELGQQLLGDYELGSSDWRWEAGTDGTLRILSPTDTHPSNGVPASISWRELVGTGSKADNAGGGEFRRLRHAVRRGLAFRGVVVPLRTGDGVVPLRTRAGVMSLRAQDEAVWCALSGRPVVDGTGNVIGYRGVASDVTPSLEAERRILHLARHDPLTGLSNRAAFQEQLEVLLAAYGAAEGVQATLRHRCALFFIDLNGFKCVNDAHGYVVGDALLKTIAGRLRAFAAGESFVARLGGNEFALLVPDLRDEAPALLARRLIAHLSDQVAFDGLQLHVGARIGIAIAPDHGTHVSALFLSADLALRAARTRTGSGAVTFDLEIKAEAGRRSALLLELGGAVHRDEIGVMFQPIVDLGTGRIVSCEALMRWRHPVEGLIPPAVFIPLAEEAGFISILGRHAIEIACREAASWPSEVALAVNVSPLQFRSPRFVDTVIDALTQSGLPPSRLELEITESVMLDTSPQILDTITELRNMGIRIALDDFGTGYASLGYVRSLRFDSLKVDQSFVADHQRPGTAAILKAVANLAAELGILTVAEGVETEAQRARLQALGYDRAQGFLFAQPMEASALRNMFGSTRELAHLPTGATPGQT